MKQYFLPRTDAAKLLWLQNFSNKLAAYKVKYNLTDAEVADIVAGYNYLSYWINYGNLFTEYQGKLTAFKAEIRNGVKPGATASVPPAPPVIAAAPAAVPPGVLLRALALANAIKSRTNYTIADGEDLGLEGADVATADVQTMKPPVSTRIVGGGHVEVIWKKQGMDAVDIYVKRGDAAEWQFLATDTTPNYTDTFALPASGKSEVWRYKATYREDDAQVGLWSDEASITVSGM